MRSTNTPTSIALNWTKQPGQVNAQHNRHVSLQKLNEVVYLFTTQTFQKTVGSNSYFKPALVESFRLRPPFHAVLEQQSIGLTERERDIIVLVCRGLSNREIAQQLSVSVSTVNNCLHQILGKLGATNRGQAVIASLKQGLVDPLDIYSVEEWVDVLMPPIPEKQILTPRERQMLVLYAWGLNNQQVADTLSISLSAVKACVRNLYRKIGAANRIDAIMIGLKHGYLSAWDFLSPEDNADLAVAAGPRVAERLIASLRARLNSFDSDDLSFRPYMQSFNTYLQKLIHLRQAKNGTYTP